MDDAYSYLHMRGLHGVHNTHIGNGSPKEVPPGQPRAHAPSPQAPRPSSTHSSFDMTTRLNPTSGICRNDEETTNEEFHAEAILFVWSAADQGGVKRIFQSHEAYLSGQGSRDLTERKQLWGQLAYTLGCHRSHLGWRAFAVLPSSSCMGPRAFEAQISPPVRALVNGPRIGFIFTGQGAQWCAMGMELTSFQSFKAGLIEADTYLKSLGCTWSVLGKSSSRHIPAPPSRRGETSCLTDLDCRRGEEAKKTVKNRSPGLEPDTLYCFAGSVSRSAT